LAHTINKYNQGDQINENEMGVTCRTPKRDEKCTQNFSREPEGK